MLIALSDIAILVRDYDEAKAFYVDILGFELVEDLDQGDGRRWVTVTPPGTRNIRIVFSRVVTDSQLAGVGKQGAGRVIFFVTTDNFDADYALFRSRGVKFVGEARKEAFGKVAIFEDLYGNRWDLIEPKTSYVKG